VAPGPFLPTVSQFVPAVREAGDREQRTRFLGAVAEGQLTGTLAIAEHNSFDPSRVAATAMRDGDGWRLAGTKQAVVEAHAVDEIVVVARVEGTAGADGVAAFVVPRVEVAVTPVANLDLSRGLAAVDLDGVRVDAGRVLGEPGPGTAAAIGRAVDEATTALAIETVGTGQTILDVTLDYAKHREQFGVPIGSFQAIKHKFADMLIALERARATSYFAALTIAEDDERRALAVATAKVAAGDAQQRLAKEGIQVHGGIGYTWEHDMHLYVRRAKADGQLFGTAADHRARIADLLGI
jgi:alkylation response protein AidB-like acyl-CoA dehydrogenase